MKNQAISNKLPIHPYVTRKKEICNGSPIIEGTRVRVIDIAIEFDRLGYSPDRIADAHPHLSLSQIHDALSYYYEHQIELDTEIANRRKVLTELKREFVPKAEEPHGENQGIY
jgi:uncharacterized protein (DUF433 family)